MSERSWTIILRCSRRVFRTKQKDFGWICCKRYYRSIFTLTAKIWKDKTDAIGIISKQENGGGTFAHRDLAIDFYAWVFPEKRYELFKLIAGKAAFFESIQGEKQQMRIDKSKEDDKD